MHKRAYSESLGLITDELRKKNLKDIKYEIKVDEKKKKKLENVVVRIRKLEQNEEITLQTDPKDKTALYFKKDFEIEKYTFDLVFDENDNNESIFNQIGGHEIINSVCKGYKETIITYGQTGSGKTYTLFGSEKEYGIIYYFVYHLYKLCNKKNYTKCSIYLSIYEILGDTLIDLMSYQNEKNIEFYTEEYYLKTIKYPYKVVNIKSYEAAKKMIDAACMLRNVEATSQNMRSSRSHAIIQFFVNISESTISNNVKTVKDYYGVLTLVDLVGCEREEYNVNKNINKYEYKGGNTNDKTSARVLNSSLSSLNKMLRKMQMGNLDESDKRQSVLCKVLFNYIQKTCGVCLIFCFNPTLSQKSLTSSTLTMANECKKIKSKRKQLFYVNSESREAFFKNIKTEDNTHAHSTNNNNNSNKKTNATNENQFQDMKLNSVHSNNTQKMDIHNSDKDDINGINEKVNIRNNSSIFILYKNDDNNKIINITDKKSDNEKHNLLRNLLHEIVEEKMIEDKNNKNTIEQLKNDISKLKNECNFWKKETYNYHNKLKMLNKNYLKINEFLFKTLNNNSINSTNSNDTKMNYNIRNNSNSPNSYHNYSLKNYPNEARKHEKSQSLSINLNRKFCEDNKNILISPCTHKKEALDIENSYLKKKNSISSDSFRTKKNLENEENSSKKRDGYSKINSERHNLKSKPITEIYQINEQGLEKNSFYNKHRSFSEAYNYDEKKIAK
ncbi:kinesin-like protein, putative [Plasmodium berghei]|uniref:Kinesin-like protein, putative n=2 Tax=Plasmodium berghei TaxID=5821 RepID=A0A509ANL3_PLABA|nr:kinesin-like protein, putative [Plasmodium berghei ANKA]CXI78337.1 kinesin-like protein, putative [Plasmodium berghei]SCM25166.1 kinesin-like protein, putative [Plasmodium berghei]SCN27283.1 kinesin-like protein, putative [Plasmodium berghei]SCO61892.1 kinesin-like protein, putative [Plasmodium berghei]SCO63709.1 kinesin-like protein, putative [Plasmodium berghei]|eukprot:XP_034422919.1 kinesin-like protein, putative [Plasmodium berghei ANKA]